MLSSSSRMTQSSSLTLVPEAEDQLYHDTIENDEDEGSGTQVEEFPSSVPTPRTSVDHPLSTVDAFAPPSLIIDNDHNAGDDDNFALRRPRDRSRSPDRTLYRVTPRRSINSIPYCPDGNHSLRSPLKKSRSLHTINSSPDRFIPPRGPSPLDISPYRLSKSPRHLPPNERRFRHRDPLIDPFTSPPRHRARSVPSRVETFHTGSFPRSLPRYLTDEDPSAGGSPDGHPAGPPAVWRMQGSSSPRNFSPVGIEDGIGGLVSSGTGAPMFVADFLCRSTSASNRKRHEARVAAALDIDQARRVLGIGREAGWDAEVPTRGMRAYEEYSWLGESEKERELALKSQRASSPTTRSIPATPFRVLDAPLLRDDFYCTTLAYSPTAHAIAVGLGNRVYIWSETGGAESPPLRHQPVANYVTSLSFSSAEGGHSILAVGRQNGDVSLWSTFDDEVRFELALPHAVSCLSWRPSGAKKKVDLPPIPGVPVGAEELAIGDETGTVWYYAVSWTTPQQMKETRRRGQIILIAKMQAHQQQICGFAWSPDGTIFVTGGNDNRCLLFDIPGVFKRHVMEIPSKSTLSSLRATGSAESRSSEESHQRHHHCPLYSNLQAMYNSLSRPPHSQPQSSDYLPAASIPRSRLSVGEVMATLVRSKRRSSLSNSQASTVQSSPPFRTIYIPLNRQKHTLHHSAAVKAIAFAPWEPSLLATGGGSNDRCIHFYHAPSGSCLATINVHAQVTSLIWSRTRREVAATFGYAQPEHPYRIAVFAWPSCKQVVAIPWNSSGECGGRADSEANVECGRALWAISYPGGPNEIPGTDKDPRQKSGKGKGSKSESGSQLHSQAHERTSTSEESEPSLRLTAARGHKVPPIAVRADPDPDQHDQDGKTGGQSKGKEKGRGNGGSGSTVIRKGYREGGRWWSRTAEEGCIVVVSSNERVNFHEVWSGAKKSTAGRSGLLGGSKILETLQGIEDEGEEVIR